MKLRGGVLGIAISLATAGLIAGCGSSNNSGTGGAGGGAAGTTGTGGKGGTAGTGTGGTAGTGAGGRVDGGTDAPADAPADAQGDVRDGAIDAIAVCGPYGDGGAPVDASVDAGANTSFFVSSEKSTTGNLGGLTGADAKCQRLAAAVGLGAKVWHAYLSVEHSTADAGAGAINARDRIGTGPWYNSRGAVVAANLTELHARSGDPSVFIDEHGNLIPGQWTGSPQPIEHDILTGSNPDGTVAIGKTCADWTSAEGPPDGGVPDGGSPDGGSYFVARVGHSDGLGPMCTSIPSWNSAHDNAGCNDTGPRGGAGRIYCFATN